MILLVPIAIAAVAFVIDKVPASTFILALELKFTVPLNALAPDIFLIAPSDVTPVPFI